MRFDEQLDQYMKKIGCTNRELAQAAGLGTGTISRYHSGKRTPPPDSPQLAGLAHGLVRLAAETRSEGNPEENWSEEEIRTQLQSLLNKDGPEDYDRKLANLNLLLDALEVKKVNLARHMHMDPSHISRILSGKRQPVDMELFIGNVISYIIKCCSTESDLAAMAFLYGCFPEALSDPYELREQTARWLDSEATSAMDDSVQSFLEKLNDFDLNDFLRSSRFDESRFPDLPYQMPGTKFYYGVSGMMQAELDFLRTVARSDSMQDVILYNDMPMLEMSENQEFTKQFMFGMAALLRKGLRLRNIHDVHRPLPETLLGLEGWIPMYMTGQIAPYYLKEQTNQTFLHFIRSAGTVAVAGEAIAGKNENARYLVTTDQEDVSYYRRRAEDLLKRAQPLMHIFRKEQETGFLFQMKKLRQRPGKYRHICSAPPLFTMSETLLRRILERSRVGQEETEKILRFFWQMKESAERDDQSTWELELPERWSDGEEGSTRLALSWLFPDTDVCYTEEEYQEHLRQTEEYAAAHPGMSFSRNSHAAFLNIDVTVVKGQYVLISKCNIPVIHFVIYHPKIVNAFEQFVPTLGAGIR